MGQRQLRTPARGGYCPLVYMTRPEKAHGKSMGGVCLSSGRKAFRGGTILFLGMEAPCGAQSIKRVENPKKPLS